MKRWWRLVVRFEQSKDSVEQEWTEDVCIAESPDEFMRKANNSLSTRDLPRTIIAAIPIHNDGPMPHTWRKHSLVTQKGGYDVYRCIDCGHRGKRFGLSETIISDNNKGCR